MTLLLGCENYNLRLEVLARSKLFIFQQNDANITVGQNSKEKLTDSQRKNPMSYLIFSLKIHSVKITWEWY